jgi:tetratricopeptide (TPR) repeat protein
LDWAFHSSQDPQQDLERALELAQKAIALDDSQPNAHQLLSWIYMRKQQPEQGLAEAERAIALDPNYAEGYVVLADALSHGGRPEEAIGWAEKALRLNPRYPASYSWILGQAYRLAGRVEEAIAAQKQAFIRDPNFQFAYIELAWSYVFAWGWQLSQDPRTLEQAFAAAQQVIALNDLNPWAHTALSMVYLWQQQYEQALTEAERAITLDPNVADGYVVLAEVLNAVGKPEEAIGRVEEARRVGLADPHWYLHQLGYAYCLTRRPEEAVAVLRQFLTHYPNILGAHLTLAAVYSELGKEVEARAEAAEVLRLNPQFSLEIHHQRAPIKDPAVLERHLTTLRKAGLK